MSTLSLNCLLLKDHSRQVFTVEIPKTDNVSILKELIKEKKARHLAHLDASDLILWKLETPIPLSHRTGPEITEEIRAVQAHLPVEADEGNDHFQPLDAVEDVSDYWEDSPQPKHLHILVQKPSGVEGSILDELEHIHTHFWGKNRVHVVETVETIDLSISNLSQFNPLSTKILLVRKEYRIAYDAITAHAISKAGDRSILLVTGQPGIGKTFFLFYFLFRRLQEREPVALQINAQQFAILDQRGVHMYRVHAEETFSIPKGIWTLSGEQQVGPCDAFQKSKAHLLHTSSPSSHKWKHWVTQLSARMYIMDVWSPEEFRTLLIVSNLHVERGLTLFHLYGPNVRICFHILKEPTQEETHLRHVQVAATKFARDFSKSFQELLELDFGSRDVSSKIFMLRPKNLGSRHSPVLTIPTTFLLKALTLALSHDAAAQQDVVFAMLNSHPTLRSPAGWMFENMAHVVAADPARSSLQIYTSTKRDFIPAPNVMISGNDAMGHIHAPFYWRPRETNFEGIDAVIRYGNSVWALQYTVSRAHRAATNGLTEVHNIMNWNRDVKWYLVMVGSTRWEAESARNSQRLTGKWASIPVYACVMQIGMFDEQKLQQLGDLLDDAPYQGDLMDES